MSNLCASAIAWGHCEAVGMQSRVVGSMRHEPILQGWYAAYEPSAPAGAESRQVAAFSADSAVSCRSVHYKYLTRLTEVEYLPSSQRRPSEQIPTASVCDTPQGWC